MHLSQLSETAPTHVQKQRIVLVDSFQPTIVRKSRGCYRCCGHHKNFSALANKRGGYLGSIRIFRKGLSSNAPCSC